MSVVSTQLDAVTDPFRAAGSANTIAAQGFALTVIVAVCAMVVVARFGPVACAVAVMIADPAPTAVTTPLVATVATAVLPDRYVMLTVAPAGFVGTAVNDTVWPTVIEAVGGVSASAVSAGGSATTVSSAAATDPLLAAAVIVEVPGATPVTEQEVPLTDAVATLVLALVQVLSVEAGDPPVMLTEKVVVPPTFTEAVVGEIVMIVDGGGFTNPSPPPPQDHETTATSANATAHPLRRRIIARPSRTLSLIPPRHFISSLRTRSAVRAPRASS